MSSSEAKEAKGGAFLMTFIGISIALKFLTDTVTGAYKTFTSDSGEITNSDMMGGGKTKWSGSNDYMDGQAQEKSPLVYSV